MIGRRTLTIGLLASACIFAAPQALADASFFDKLWKTVTGGYDTFAGTAKAADQIKASDYAAEDRPKVIDEIDKLIQRLDRLLSGKALMIDNMQYYIKRARKPGPFPAEERDAMWSGVTGDVTTLVTLVQDVQSMLLNSKYLKDKLDAATRSGLNQVMLERIPLLDQVRTMPAPTSTAEIEALERLAEQHSKLRDRTEALRRSLFSARDRLAGVQPL